MKFRPGEYYKHVNCIDAFINVQAAPDIDELVVSWLVQGVHNYWLTPVVGQRIKVTAENYPKWGAYTPHGSIL